MAKQSKQSGADDLIDQLDGMAEKLKSAIDDLILANKQIDAEAAMAKQPNIEKAKKLNLAYMRLTGKSHLKDETPGSGGGVETNRKRRSSSLMEELAKQVADVLSHNKNGISGPNIRKAVSGLEEGDNISLLLKKFKHKFNTEGPRQQMLYLPA